MLTLLPDALLSILLTDWLDVRDVVFLDSSLCASFARGDFLKVLHMYSPAALKNASVGLTNNWLNWCIRRRVVCCALCLEDCNAELLTTFLEFCGQTITTAAFCFKYNPLQQITLSCENIVDLSLSGSEIAGDDILDLICGTRVQRLTLKMCYISQLSDSNRAYPTTCRPLNHLNCENSNVDDDFLRTLLPLCPLLQNLQLWACGRVTNATAFAIAEHNCALQVLGLAGTRVCDAGIVAIARSLTALKEFAVGHALDRTVVVTLPAVDAVLTQCAQLEGLSIGQCHHLTVDCIDVILLRCPNLTLLHLGGLFSATDADLIKIAHGFQWLEHLAIPVSKHLTDRSIRYVAEHCTKLTCITIPYPVLRQLSKETAKAFRPGVEIRDRLMV
jgi:hypothetical protein